MYEGEELSSDEDGLWEQLEGPGAPDGLTASLVEGPGGEAASKGSTGEPVNVESEDGGSRAVDPVAAAVSLVKVRPAVPQRPGHTAGSEVERLTTYSRGPGHQGYYELFMWTRALRSSHPINVDQGIKVVTTSIRRQGHQDVPEGLNSGGRAVGLIAAVVALITVTCLRAYR